MAWSSSTRIGRYLLAKINPNIIALFAIILSVQGVVVMAQFCVATIVTPAELGVIRWVESAFSVALLLASWGMPTVLFREAALAHQASNYPRLFQLGAIIVTGCSLTLILIGSLVFVFAPKLTIPEAREFWLIIMAGVLIPSSIARCGVAIIQGARLAIFYWSKLLIYSILALLLLILGTWMWGLKGWLLARYLSEIILVGLISIGLAFTRDARSRSVEVNNSLSLSRFFIIGSISNLAFLARASADSLPIFLLGVFAIDPNQLGYWGFASLLTLGPQIIMSVYGQYLLPQLVQTITLAEQSDSLTLRRFRRSFFQIGVMGGMLLGIIAMLMAVLPSSAYSNGAATVLILGLGLPARALFLANGAALMASQNYKAALFLNVIEVLILLVLVTSFKTNQALELAIITICSGAIVSVLSFRANFNR